MVSIRKRGAVYGVIGLMLCVAVYLNWSYFQAPDELADVNQALGAESDEETSGQVYGAVTAVDSEDTAGSGSGETAQTSSSDYFAQARLSRQTSRDQALSLLKETVSSTDASEDAKKEASEKITEIAGDTVKEERVESQIKAKGYSDAVVYISDDAISVVVASSADGLKAADAAAISDIIVAETGAEPSMIRISEAK